MTENDLTTAQLKGQVDVKSIDTKNGQRDRHLKASDFFDATGHLKISFSSTKIEKKVMINT